MTMAGDGSSGDPWQITTLDQLIDEVPLKSNLHHFILMDDIDATPTRYINALVNKGSWSATTSYDVNDRVTHGDDTYYCIVSHTSDADFSTDVDNWIETELPVGHVLGFKQLFPATAYGVRLRGSFNGNGKTIHGLYINRPDEEFVGFLGVAAGEVKDMTFIFPSVVGLRHVAVCAGYGYSSDTPISNIEVINGAVCAVATSDNSNAALVAGWNRATITGCRVRGVVQARSLYAGGVSGYTDSNGSVSDCKVEVKLIGHLYCGLIAARIVTGSSISDCEAKGIMYVTGFSGGITGGLTGTLTGCTSDVEIVGSESSGYIGGCFGESTFDESAIVQNCVAHGSVSGGFRVGGFGGNARLHVDDCLSTTAVLSTGSFHGGMFGSTSEDFIDDENFWNTDTAVIETSNGGQGKTTEELLQVATYGVNWDLEVVDSPYDRNITASWNMAEGQCYPFPSWLEPPTLYDEVTVDGDAIEGVSADGVAVDHITVDNFIVYGWDLHKLCGDRFMPSGNPIAGYIGYDHVITLDDLGVGDVVVTNATEFKSAISTVQEGHIIYIHPHAVIDMTGENVQNINRAITVASNRGEWGAPGGKIIKMSSESDPEANVRIFNITVPGVRVTGLQIEGPNYYGFDPDVIHRSRCAFWSYRGDTEVDNCDIWNFAHGNIRFQLSTDPTKQGELGNYAHHLYSHDSWATGLGYPIIGANQTTVEGCYLHGGRHPIVSGRNTMMIIRDCYITTLPTSPLNSTAIDMHQDSDNRDYGGWCSHIHNNTIHCGSRYATIQRGYPRNGVWIHNNYVTTNYHHSFRMRYYGITGDANHEVDGGTVRIGRIYAFNNVLETASHSGFVVRGVVSYREEPEYVEPLPYPDVDLDVDGWLAYFA